MNIYGKITLLPAKSGTRKDGTPFERPQFMVSDPNNERTRLVFDVSQDKFAQLTQQGLVNNAVGTVHIWPSADEWQGRYINNLSATSFEPQGFVQQPVAAPAAQPAAGPYTQLAQMQTQQPVAGGYQPQGYVPQHSYAPQGQPAGGYVPQQYPPKV